eukprot:Skav225121  [mRNA]  locus=scaffold1239:278040:279794:- [translate_table: standard]
MLPVPNRSMTLKVLHDFPDNVQRILARDVTGAYLQTSQKQHFQESPVCRNCGEADTTEHRILHCSATQSVRDKHPEVLDHLRHHNACFFHLPVAFRDEWYDFRAFWFQRRPLPQPNDDVLLEISRHMQGSGEAWFSTDGSCVRPTSVDQRRAAFAAVFHPKVQSSEAAILVESFQAPQKLPSTFLVLFTGECSHRQTTARAELQSVMHLADTLASLDLLHLHHVIHTDSQYVMNLLQKLGLCVALADFEQWPNFDNVRVLWNALQQGHLIVRKIKAHQEHATHSDPLSHFHALGNAAADRAAKTSLRCIEHACPLDCEGVDAPQRLQQQYAHLNDLQTLRATLYKHPTQSHSAALTDGTMFDHFLHWQPEEVWQPTPPDEEAPYLRGSLWGPGHSLRLLQWLSTLQWQVNPSAHDKWLGTSWYELCYSFLATTGAPIAVNQTPEGPFRPRLVSPQAETTAFTKLVFAFERAVTHLTKLSQQPWVPSDRGHVFGLTVLGSRYCSSGIRSRAVLPQRISIYQHLRNHFAQVAISQSSHRRFEIWPGHFDTVPSGIFLPHPHDLHDDTTGWRERRKRYNRYRKQLPR